MIQSSRPTKIPLSASRAEKRNHKRYKSASSSQPNFAEPLKAARLIKCSSYGRPFVFRKKAQQPPILLDRHRDSALSFLHALAVKVPLILTLWGRYVLWWPTAWLEKYIHRCYLAALVVLIVTGVVLALTLVSVTVIVAAQLAQLAASASASTSSINTGLIGSFNLISGLAKAEPIAALISALATGGGVTSTFVGMARDTIRQVLVSIPVILLQLIIVFFLLLGILGRGDTIVNDFKGGVPLKYRSIPIDSWTISTRSTIASS